MTVAETIFQGYNKLHNKIYGSNTTEHAPTLEEKIDLVLEQTQMEPTKLFNIIKYYMNTYDSNGYMKTLSALLDIKGNKAFIWEKCLAGATMTPVTKTGSEKYIKSGWYWRQQNWDMFENFVEAMQWVVEHKGHDALLEIINKDKADRDFEEDVPCMHRLVGKSQYRWNNGDCNEFQYHLKKDFGFTYIHGNPFCIQPPQIIETKALEEIIQEATK